MKLRYIKPDSSGKYRFVELEPTDDPNEVYAGCIRLFSHIKLNQFEMEVLP